MDSILLKMRMESFKKENSIIHNNRRNLFVYLSEYIPF